MSGQNQPKRKSAQLAVPRRDLDKLPDDLGYAIFKPFFCTDAGNLASVAKRWRDRFQPPSHLWDDVQLTIRQGNTWEEVPEQRLQEAALWLKKRTPVARRLRLVLDHESFTDWSGSRTVLRREMVEAFQSIMLEAMEIRIPYCTQSPGDLRLLVPHLTSLRSLTICDWSCGVKTEQLNGLEALASLTGLRELFVDASTAYDNTSNVFPSALLALTQLRKLALRVRKFRNDGLVTDLSRLVKLQALELDCFSVTGGVLEGLSNLTSLKLAPKLTTEHTKELRFPPSLRQAHFSCSALPLELAACTALTRLELLNSDHWDIDAIHGCNCCRGLSGILRRTSLLERLRLEHFHTGVIPAIASLGKLQHLDIRLHGDEFEFKALLSNLLEGNFVTQLKVLRLGELKSLPRRLAKAVNLEILDASETHVDSDSVKHLKLMLRLPKLKRVIWPFGDCPICGDHTGKWEDLGPTRKAEKLWMLLEARNPHLDHDHENWLVTQEMQSLAAEAWPTSAP